ncbi:hypothetical protein GH714_022809 [Hevea brasiliensis]|uniref:Uncharacterized protein n=1 Tax=Hevea brasiliensis TaxID=3981 RepID=A0A6A6LZW5_HEVBR|nr:hypothetical protein GH714_022809 [Hevea brasiliensis]
MGTYLLLQLSFTTPPSQPLLKPNKFADTTWPIATTVPKNSWCTSSSAGRVKINLQDELYTDGDDDYDEFGFSGGEKQRIWWSNDDEDIWVDDDEEDDFWIFKVIRAFGWMVPAIGISLLLGTGPSAFLMALAVPLGQTALSALMDKVSRPRPKTETGRTKKKTFVRSSKFKRGETSRRREENKSQEEKGSYQSWMAADRVSYKNSGKRVRKFGGWDELDATYKVPRGTPRQKADELPKQQTKGKMSRTRIIRDTPLLLRENDKGIDKEPDPRAFKVYSRRGKMSSNRMEGEETIVCY